MKGEPVVGNHGVGNSERDQVKEFGISGCPDPKIAICQGRESKAHAIMGVV